MVGVEAVRGAVRENWRCGNGDRSTVSAGPVDGTWLVEVADRRFLAKQAPVALRRQFEASLAAAEHLANAGLAIGEPLRAADGALTVVRDDVVLALVRFLPGRVLDGTDPTDQMWWGDALGVAHRAMVGFTHPAVAKLCGVRADGVHLAVEDWLRPAVAAAIDAVARLSVTDQLSYGVLHGDPGPEAFRIDADTGVTGLVSWPAVATGPLVHDVAGAVLHAGGLERAEAMLQAYVSAGPVPADEIDVALPTLLRLRHAMQADHFARRIWDRQQAGVADGGGATGDGDRLGLRSARQLLEA